MKNLTNSKRKSLAKSISKVLMLIGFLLFIAAGASAQGPGGPTDDPDTPVPFDGGISLLVAAGVAYGAKQWHSNRKAGNEDEEKVNL